MHEAVRRARASLPASIEAWPEALVAMPPGEVETLLGDLYLAWVKGALGTDLLDDGATSTCLEADRRLGRMLLRLSPRLIDRLKIVWHPDWDDECEDDWDYDRLRKRDLRRWCWAPGWWLMQQDEDLLMGDQDVVPLLEEARERCRKRDDAISIVKHHARDSVHHELWDGAKGLGGSLARLTAWIEPARAAQAEDLVEYLERLASYAVPRSVESAEVAQRVLDLRRCEPNPSDVPQVRRSGATWVARLDRANVTRGALFVEVDSGRMWAQVE